MSPSKPGGATRPPRAYDIFWQTSDADWQNEQDYLMLVLVSFSG